ncbi:MAG: hypothetical protein IT585_01485 [candidate division Zixibacteria bacterium]|nr:hypothetical protein [candidate division Zixibacteria bacterium]
MKCSFCGSDEVVTGILEGISFIAKSDSQRMQTKGLYGIQANFCQVCGRLDRFEIERVVTPRKATAVGLLRR